MNLGCSSNPWAHFSLSCDLGLELQFYFFFTYLTLPLAAFCTMHTDRLIGPKILELWPSQDPKILSVHLHVILCNPWTFGANMTLSSREWRDIMLTKIARTDPRKYAQTDDPKTWNLQPKSSHKNPERVTDSHCFSKIWKLI